MIDKEIVIEAMEEAIQKSARNRYGAENDIRAKLDPVTGDLRLWRVVEVVEEVEDYFKQVDLAAAQKLQADAKVGDFIVDPLPAIDLGRIEHHLFLSYARKKLIVVGTRNQTAGTRAFVWYDTQCVSAEDGKQVWTATQDQRQGAGGSHGEQDHHPVIVGDTVYVEPYAYDLETGQRTASWSLGRGGHGCGSISASAKMCFFRAGNPTMCELASGAKTKVTRVSRPGCWINMIPAGGLVLIPEASSGCVCDFPIQASMAFASRALSGVADAQ